LDWNETLERKSSQGDAWSDDVNINAMCELYNVRVKIYQFNKFKNTLFISYQQGDSDQTIQELPVILLARHSEKHYNVIKNPEAYAKKPRPLSAMFKCDEKVSVREIRMKQQDIKEDQKQLEIFSSGLEKLLFQVQLQPVDFNNILQNQLKKQETLTPLEVEKIFPLCLAEIYKKNCSRMGKRV